LLLHAASDARVPVAATFRQIEALQTADISKKTIKLTFGARPAVFFSYKFSSKKQVDPD